MIETGGFDAGAKTCCFCARAEDQQLYPSIIEWSTSNFGTRGYTRFDVKITKSRKLRWKNKINQRLNHQVNKKRKYKEIQGKEEETIDSSSRKILSGCGTRFLNKGSGVVER